MASAEREPITGVWRRSDRIDPLYPSPCKNSSDFYQFQERPLAKVGLTLDMSTGTLKMRDKKIRETR